MQFARSIAEIRTLVAAARSAGHSIALVPTMGALHAGHASLMEAARASGAFVVVSIFVNPTQFGPNEDFDRYPRDESGDSEFCRRCGVAALFMPPVREVYPDGFVTVVRVPGLSETLCGEFRPGHFDGVATVVAKLLNMVRPDAAYFGEKDAQQLAVIRRMARDLDLPAQIVGCPIVREPDGLALSSRNAYLSPAERAQATSLYAALRHAQRRIAEGETDSAKLIREARERIESAGAVRIDYVRVVSPETLQPVPRVTAPALIALAVHIGRTRLIDNVVVDPGAGRG